MNEIFIERQNLVRAAFEREPQSQWRPRWPSNHGNSYIQIAFRFGTHLPLLPPATFPTILRMPQAPRKDVQAQKLQDKEAKRARGSSVSS